MATASIGKLNVAITATADEFNRIVDDIQGKIKGLPKAAGQALADSKFGGFLSGATLLKAGAGIAAVGAAAGVAFSQLRKVGDEADEVADTAEVLGVSADELVGLRLAAGGAGEAFGLAFNKFQKAISEANAGNKELQETFKRIGLDAGVLAEMSPTAAWLDFVGALGKVESSADRINARMSILGKGSAAVADRLAKGVDHWTAQLNLAEGTQGHLKALADAADRYEVTSARLSVVWKSLKADAAGVLSDVIEAAASAKEFTVATLSGTGGPGRTGLTGFDQQRERMMAQLRATQKQAAEADKRAAELRAAEGNARIGEAQQEIARMRSPLEEAADEMAKAKRLFGPPFAPEVMDRAFGAIADKLIRDAGIDRPHDLPGSPAAHLRGSAGARTAQLEMERQREMAAAARPEKLDQLKQAIEKLQTAAQAEKNAQKIADALKQLQPVRGVGIP